MRGEGNHKIPGSFAPENMEKTGAERVKYSLACQHEDAIPIKFVSYALKCPTVLCTFAVALRKESVDRNCPARRAVACLRRSGCPLLPPRSISGSWCALCTRRSSQRSRTSHRRGKNLPGCPRCRSCGCCHTHRGGRRTPSGGIRGRTWCGPLPRPAL